MYKQPMLKDDTLKGKVIVVTGGGTGLGKSMATYFATIGASIIITSRKEDVINKTAIEISEQTSAKTLPVVCDVRDYDQVERMLQQSISAFGKVDALLNNAAGN